MAIIVALPATGIILHSGLAERQDAMNEARTEARKLADNIATEQQTLVASAKQVQSALAQLPEIKRQNTAKVQSVLTDILKINPQFLNIFILNRDGLMWVSAKPSKIAVPSADRRYFINARTTGQFSSGEYIVGRLLGKPTLSFGYPYKDWKGEFSGVIVVNIDLEYSRKLLERSHLPKGSSYALIDHQGVILNRGIDPASFIGKRDNPDRFRRMQGSSDSGDYIGPGLDGSLRFISYRKLRLDGEQTPYMYIRAGIPVNMAVAAADRALYFNLAMFSSFLLLAFIVAWLVGKRSIVNRIKVLQSVAHRLAGGDLQARVSHLVTGGELGDLGHALDDMACALARDLSARNQAEDAQRESERFLRTIVDTEPECVKMVSVDGSLLMMNRAGLEMIGAASFDQVKGKSIYPIVAPEHRSAFKALTGRVFQGIEGTLEFEIMGLNGRRLWLETHAVPFRNEKGEVLSLLAVTRNITDRKKAEEEIAGLHRSLAAHASELEAANRELEAFNYTVSHDLRAPLTNLNCLSSLLIETCAHGQNEKGHRYLAQIQEEGRRMEQLISTLLEFSRLSHCEVKREIVNLSEIALSIALELKLENPDRRVQFNVMENVTGNADPRLIKIALENLIGNAWKYTAKQDAAIIDFGMTESGEGQACFVRDNGVGFDMKDAGRLFGTFQRLHTSDEFEGYGIGLATVQRILKRHGGDLWAEAAVGKGATFYFTLETSGEKPD
jgi:PAS domain S-box-containing protein